MKFSQEIISILEERVKKRMSEKRFRHTRSVVFAVQRIGRYFEDLDLSELCAAALLHDITKELSVDEQIRLLIDGGFVISDEDMESPQIFHSFSAPIIIKSDFPKFATESVLSAVKNHTLGSPDMTVFDEIIFISDYIEDLRTYDSCIEVRKKLYDALSHENTVKQNVIALHEAVLSALIFTEKEVLKRGITFNSRSKKTKDYFYRLLSN